MVKAIFFDIDGTLVSFQTHTVPESTREALRLLREKGIKVFIATGRPKTLYVWTKLSQLTILLVTMTGATLRKKIILTCTMA